MEYLAHTGGARVQTLLEHLEGTAELAEQFGAAFGSGDFARMTALAHDLGKYSSAFQRRLRGDLGRVDHSTFGAQAVRTVGGLIPAYCVAGHHGGLPDGGGTADTGDEPTLYGRLRRNISKSVNAVVLVNLIRRNIPRDYFTKNTIHYNSSFTL